MKLKKLEIVKFRGIANKVFDLNDKINCFKGSNEMGKSTCLDGLMLLLTGETYVYGKTMESNRDLNHQKEVNELSLYVETDEKSFDDNGDIVSKIVKLSIKQYEYWKTRKGTNEVEYDSFKTDYFYNDTSVAKEEYFNKLKDLFNINYTDKITGFNVLRLLVDPTYTNEVEAKSLKKLIETICKITPDFEILTQKELKPCAKILADNDFDIKLATKYLNSNISNCEKELIAQNSAIETTQKFINDYEVKLEEIGDIEAINNEINQIELKKNITKEEREKENELRSSVNELDLEIKAMEQNEREQYNRNIAQFSSDSKKYNNDLVVVMNEISSITDKHNKIVGEKNKLNFKLQQTQNELDQKNKSIEYKNKLLNELEISSIVEKHCPNCNCIINQEEIDNFESEKKRKSISIKEEIGSLASDVKRLSKEVEELNLSIKDFELEINEWKGKYATKQKELEEVKKAIKECDEKPMPQFEYSMAYHNKCKDLENAKTLHNSFVQSVKNIHTLSQEDLDRLNVLNNNINTYNYTKSQLGQTKTQLEIVENKKNELLDLKCELELKQNALDKFKQIKAKLIKENTSKVFGDIEWVLQEESKKAQKTKDVERCYATLNGVSMNGVNTASQLVLGTKIIACIKKALGVVGLPIIFDIVDNIGEKATNEILENSNQIFCTQVIRKNGVALRLDETID